MIKAWEVLFGDGSSVYTSYRSNIENLNKVNEYLGFNPNKVDELVDGFININNKADFIRSFIGGPLRKNELEDLNNLYYKQANTYDDGSGVVLTSSEISRLDELETQIGSYEYPNILNTNSSQVIVNTSTSPQPGPANFWADVKVANGKIEGLIPNKKYDYVITYSSVGSAPELRLGLGHYIISGEADAVKGAGSLRFNSEGKIYYINRQSGHYISIPNSNLAGELDETVNILNSNGLTVSDIDVDYSL